jgi:glucose-6-phosphate isomerase
MSLPNVNPTQTPAWQKLRQHFESTRNVQMADLFAQNPGRYGQFALCFEDMLADISKNILTDETLPLLRELADRMPLPEAIEALFTGKAINATEGRAVLHVALRNRANAPILVDGKDVMPEVNEVLRRMETFANQVVSGAWKGHSGKAITDVVNIGIGGSTSAR